VEDCEDGLDLEDTSSVPSTVHNSIIKASEPECLDDTSGLPNACLNRTSKGNGVAGNKLSIPGQPGTHFLEHQFWAILFIVRRWVWNSDIPEALVADEMGLTET